MDDSIGPPAVEEILKKLARDAIDGHLLLFVGTGFSKAALPASVWWFSPTVPSWTELLRELSRRMGLDPDKYVLPVPSKFGASSFGEDPEVLKKVPNIDYACPTIATRICKDWESNPGNAGKDGGSVMKELIASLSVWVPMKDMRERLCKVLVDINPIGIITTNYDMVLEAILAEKGQYLAREELFRQRNDGRIPIWHVHGSIQQPESIIVTNNDYQQFFRPDDYVQRKISMLLHEYTTLFIGYSMSDPNITTAVDWAMNVFKTKGPSKDTIFQIRLVHAQGEEVIQQDTETKSMYYIHTKDSIDFIERLQKFVLLGRSQNNDDTVSKITDLLFRLSERENVVRERSSREFERVVVTIKELARQKHNPDLILKLMPYVQSCIANARERAKIDYNFQAYSDWLFILLAVLKDLSFDEIPPALFALLGEELDAVLARTGYNRGQSYPANDLWLRESKTISTDVLNTFLEYARRLQLTNLLQKLESVLGSPNLH
jgi:hypothetical protein